LSFLNLLHALACDGEIGGRCPLRLLDESMEHNRESAVKAKQHSRNPVA